MLITSQGRITGYTLTEDVTDTFIIEPVANIIAPKAFVGVVTDIIIIKDGITCIQPQAFCGAHARKIVMADSVTEVGYEAFMGIKELEEVQLSKNLKSLSENMFKDCVKLSKVYPLDASIEQFEGVFSNCPLYNNSGVLYVNVDIPDNAYADRSDITTVYIGKDVHHIGSGAFKGCINLIRVNTHPNILSVGDHAFAKCKKLQSVFFGESVMTWGTSVLDDCPQVILQTHYNSTPFRGRDGHRFTLNIVQDVPISDYPTELLYEHDAINNYLKENNITTPLTEIFGIKTSGSPSSIIKELSLLNNKEDEFVIENGILKHYNGNATNVVIPETVIGINEYAFYRKLQVESITLPMTLLGFDIGGEDSDVLSVNEVGATFNCMPNLRELSINGTNSTYTTVDGMLLQRVDDGDSVVIACPPKHADSAKYNRIIDPKVLLNSADVVQALDALGIEDKAAAIVERVGEVTTLPYVDLMGAIYVYDLKPQADAALSKYQFEKSIEEANKSLTQVTPEQKAARSLLFGKK